MADKPSGGLMQSLRSLGATVRDLKKPEATRASAGNAKWWKERGFNDFERIRRERGGDAARKAMRSRGR